MKAGEILKTADSLINGDRAASYGDALATHQKIADQWTQTLTLAGMKPEKPLTAEVVAWLMADLKKVRAYCGPFHADSFVDCTAYIALAGEIKSRVG